MRCTPTFLAGLLALLATNVLAAPVPQLAGVGAGSDSIFTSADNGIGYGVEDAEDNTAANIDAIKGAVAARQLNKIANGATAVGDAAGAGVIANPTGTELNNVDGQTTNDAATVGAQVGNDEETTLEQVGSDTP